MRLDPGIMGLRQKVGRSTHNSAYFHKDSSSRKKQLRTNVLTCTHIVYVISELYKNENVVEGGFFAPPNTIRLTNANTTEKTGKQKLRLSGCTHV